MQKQNIKLPLLHEIALFLLFFLGFLAVWWYGYHEKQLENQYVIKSFHRLAADVCEDIGNEKKLLTSFLNTTAGVINASEVVTEKEWSSYTRAVKLQEEYPYINSLSYVANLKRDELKLFFLHTVSKYYPSLHHIVPDREDVLPRHAYVTILTEPAGKRANLLGFDFSSEEKLKNLFDRATEEMVVRFSEPLSIGISKKEESIFALFPVYKSNVLLDTIQQRHNNVKGWVVASISPALFARHVLEHSSPYLNISLYLEGRKKAFFTQKQLINRDERKPLIINRQLMMGDQIWHITVSTSFGFIPQMESMSHFLLFFLAYLVLFFSWFFIRRQMIERVKAADRAEGMEKEAEESEQVFQDMFYQNETPMFLVDPQDASFINVNDAACRYSGYSREELTSMKISDINTEWGEGVQQKMRSIMAGTLRKARTHHRLKSGASRTVEISTSLLNMHGRKCYVSLVHDVTEQEKYEIELYEKTLALQELNKNLEERVATEINKQKEQEQIFLQQSKLAAMGEMMSNVAHQWRQPLNALGIIIQDIQDAFSYGDLTEEYIEKLEDTAMAEITKMSAIIDDFSNYFQHGREKSPFSLIEETDQIKALFTPQLAHNDISFHIECLSPADTTSGEPYIIYGVPSEYAQILFTFICNSKDAILQKRKNLNRTDEHHTIEKGEIIFLFRASDSEIILTIKDNGCGVDADVLPRLFEPYYTTKVESGGIGMGLYTAKVIIEKNMHGKISLKCEHGWTYVTITLPRYKEQKKDTFSLKEEKAP